MTQKHISVLLNEVIELLNINSNGIYVDCTLGRAGHSAEILKKLKKGHLYAIDQDSEAIAESSKKLSKISNNFTILEGNFVDLKVMLALNQIKEVDGVLYDLGVSSPQFDDGHRGFSYRYEAMLDMRMDTKNNDLTAKEIINTFSEQKLAEIFYRYGDEKFAFQIAKNIVKERRIKEIISTFELVDIIKKSFPQKILKQKKHPAKKVFQALRVFVNNELDVLKKSLEQALELIKPGARIVVITFQSHEEKIVKDIFKSKTINEIDKFLTKLPINNIELTKKFELVIKKPILPSDEELSNNRRAHSAKAWVIQKVV